MVSFFLFAGCLLPGPEGAGGVQRGVQAGPGGEVVATNVIPWALYPGADLTFSAQELREIRIVDAHGREVRARKVTTPLAQGTRIQVVPEAPLTAQREFRLVVGGALSKSFRTGPGLDLSPPDGGELRDWTWSRGECPRLRVRVTPVVDEGPVWWDLEGRLGDTVAIHASAPLSGESFQLSGCGEDAVFLPRGDLAVTLRWVDLAGNATPSWPTVVIPTRLEQAAGQPAQGISSVP